MSKKKSSKKILIIIISTLIFAVLSYGFYCFKFAKHYPKNINLLHKKNYFGITFSKKFASQIGLDWKEVYKMALEDLKVKYIRIPIYWDDIEKKEGEFDFEDYDYIFEEGKKYNVKFIAAIGLRLPRWPECHFPAFLKNSIKKGNQLNDKTKEKILLMLKKVANHYKNNKEIIYWQIENEPLLEFYGECPKSNYEFLRKEVNLVRNLNNKPIIITASGELASWDKEIQLSDIFGTTVYRVVWAWWFGYSRYPFPTWFYNWKADKYNIGQKEKIITEFQLEPWVPKGKITELSKKEIDKSMGIEQFKANIQYVIDMDWKQAYAWGIEWWYWQYKNGNKEYWELAKKMF
jgi:hypothetical protein